jgi:hypothetical protein
MATTTNYGWTTPNDTDLVKDGAAAIRTLGSSVDTTTKALNPSTTLGDIEYRSATANTNTRLAIGTTGQVLSVVGGVPAWATSDDANAIQNAIVDAKGDLIAASAADTPARLAVGANGTVLTADSAEATGLKWATPAGGGKVLQVVEGSYSTQVNNSTTTFQDTNVTANITPSSASSKILIIVKQHGYKDAGDIESGLIVRLMRDSTSIDDVSGFYTATSIIMYGELTLMKLDAPNTTSQITYKTQFRNNAAAAKVSVNVGYPSRITLMEIGA